MRYEESVIEGRNAVLEAFRSGKTVDRVFLLKGCQDGPILTIAREARKQGSLIQYVPKERLGNLSPDGKHQGVVAYTAAYAYASVEDMLELAEKKGEPPFLFLLDGIEDPHNLGAIIRTANLGAPMASLFPNEGLRASRQWWRKPPQAPSITRRWRGWRIFPRRWRS